MVRIGCKVLSTLALMSALAVCARAQTATYRLHKESSTTTGLFQLKTANPDGTSLAIQSANLKGVAAGEYLVKAFDTQSGVPNASGTIPAGSTITFSVWMRKTTTGGTLFPRAKLRLNSATGLLVGTATSATALTSTLAKYTFTTTTTANVTMTAADRLYVWVGVNLTAAPTTNTTAELDVEGTANGNYDSLVTVPLPVKPQISAVSPAAGPAGTSVTISGSNFGATQGASTVTFNGVAATPTSWSAGTIVAPVPAGATTGPVVVNVNGSASNGQTFSVGEVGSLVGTVTRAGDGAAVAGAQVKAMQSGVVKATATTGADGAYTLSLLAGTYDVQATAVGYDAQTQTAQQVTGQATTAVNFTLSSVFITYIYDELGRLVGAVDPNGETVRYGYDAVGNLTSVSRQSSAQVSIVEFSPNGGAVGATVVIYGTGFSGTPGQNAVTFNGTAAAVTSSTSTRIVTSVPAGATTGLIAVTTPAGTATSATPFTVGNPTAPTITAFTPTVGSAGTAVTITGTNFQTTTSSNRVTFNGIRATVSSATATSLVAAVPAGASSGRLAVITPEGKAVSASDFYVPPPGYTGADVESTGRIAFNVDQTVTITTGGKLAMLLFDGTAGQRISLNMGGGSMGWAQVSIINPNGSYLIGPSWINGGGFFGPNVLPADGTYTIVVDPENANTGSLTLHLYDVPPDSVRTTTPGGPDVVVTNTVPGQNARLTFAGTAGQRVTLNMGSGSMGWALVSIINPDGTNLINPSWTNGGGFFGPVTLPATGTYTILVDPENANTGSMTLHLYDVPPDASATITPGGPSVTLTTTTPGQNARFTFSGTAGQRISLGGGWSAGWALASIINPDGTNLINPSWGSGGIYFDVRTLPADGTYTILIDPENANTGNITLTLYDVPPDPTATITPGGPSVTVTTTAPGQNARFTFTGRAGQRISLGGGWSAGWALASIINPDGTNLINPSWGSGGIYFDVRTLPADGTYTILIDPENGNTGNITLTLYDVPPDPAATITAGGPSVTLTTTTPGQNARFTFSGTAGQRISLGGGWSAGWALASIINPDGTNLINPSWGSGGIYFDVRTLPADGTYTILIDPENGNTGNITLTLYDVPPDPTATITPGGPSVTLTTTTPGQNARLTFDGAAGQSVSINMGNGSMGWALVSVVNPDGTNLVNPTWTIGGGSFGPLTLPAAGTYTIVIDPENGNVGSMTVTVNNP